MQHRALSTSEALRLSPGGRPDPMVTSSAEPHADTESVGF